MDKRLLLMMLLAVVPASGFAAGGGAPLDSANVNVADTAALQRGAAYYVNNCLGCHSLEYVRYNRLADDLGLTEDQVTENLMYTGERIHDTMTVAMPADDSSVWFGRTPPDLSLVARSRGEDWIYTFLKSFYVDPSKPTGANNTVLVGASMPHVLWEQQGLQRAIFHEEIDEAGNPHTEFEGFELVSAGSMSPEAFDRMIRDIVTFLSYAGEPMQLERQRLGVKVLLFLLVFFVLAFLLKKEIWKDVK
jgi:ubiquinol-cytochrome c reductase cytochrome c1 subunit